MKQILCMVLVAALCFGLVGCSLLTDHQQYTAVEDYPKIFGLTEIRFKEDAFELFPKSLEGLTVKEFYFDWLREFIGSASVQMHLAVEYNDNEFEGEVARLKSLGNGTMMHEINKFHYDAYASILGYMCTNYYALLDKETNTVHYLLVQIVDEEDIKFDKKYLPFAYYDSGSVEGANYNIYADEGSASM